MAKKKPAPKPLTLTTELELTFPDNIQTRMSNHQVVQTDQDGFHLSFFEIRAPILVGDDREKQQEQLKKIGAIPANCVARIMIPASRMKSFIESLQRTYEAYETIKSSGASNGRSKK